MSSPTFAEKTKQKITPLISFSHPSEEQGVIFEHIDGLKIRDYLLAIYKLVGGAKNIIAASRVSGGKVIIFLSSREIVEKFQSEHGGFKIGENYVVTRKLKAPSVKIILSNVSPIIPNAVIEASLTQLGLKPITPISILRFNPSDDIFSHVISWRRQFYLPANTDLAKIPPVISVIYEERTYRIFLTKGDFVCFKCSKKGHKAENCIETPFDEEVEDNIGSLEPPLQPKIAATTLPVTSFPPLPPVEQPSVSSQMKENRLVLFKRKPSEIASSTTSDTQSLANAFLSGDSDFDEQKSTQTKDKKKKKSKKHKPNPNSETYLKPLILSPEEIKIITELMKHLRQTKFPGCDFTAEDLIKFLPTLRGNLNKRQLADNFTNNTECLLFILEEIKSQMETGTKRTITSLTRVLITGEYPSDSSDTPDIAETQ